MTDSPDQKPRFQMTRRRLILGGSLIGGALVVGYAAANPMQAVGAILQGGGGDPEPCAFGPFIRITDDGWVTIVNKQQELGQASTPGSPRSSRKNSTRIGTRCASSTRTATSVPTACK